MRFLFVDDHPTVAFFNGQRGGWSGVSDEEVAQWELTSSDVLEMLTPQQTDSGTINDALATQPISPPDATNVLHKVLVSEGAVHAGIYVTYPADLGPELLRYYISRSFIADQCPPLDESNI